MLTTLNGLIIKVFELGVCLHKRSSFMGYHQILVLFHQKVILPLQNGCQAAQNPQSQAAQLPSQVDGGFFQARGRIFGGEMSHFRGDIHVFQAFPVLFYILNDANIDYPTLVKGQLTPSFSPNCLNL